MAWHNNIMLLIVPDHIAAATCRRHLIMCRITWYTIFIMNSKLHHADQMLAKVPLQILQKSIVRVTTDERSYWIVTYLVIATQPNSTHFVGT